MLPSYLGFACSPARLLCASRLPVRRLLSPSLRKGVEGGAFSLVPGTKIFVLSDDGDARWVGEYLDFEIMIVICRSVVQRGKVKPPLGPGEPELEALKKVLPD
jgi:hypothetical protein